MHFIDNTGTLLNARS